MRARTPVLVTWRAGLISLPGRRPPSTRLRTVTNAAATGSPWEPLFGETALMHSALIAQLPPQQLPLVGEPRPRGPVHANAPKGARSSRRTWTRCPWRAHECVRLVTLR